MKPLLWKEIRDLRPWVLSAWGLAAVLALCCYSPTFKSDFLSVFVPFMPGVVMMVAAALGAGQIARERSSRTLEFVLVRPVAPARILFSKFLAGTAALAMILPVALALCFLDRGNSPDETSLVLREAAAPSTLAMILFPRIWCIYGVALLFSALLDRTAKAVAGFVVAMVALLALAAAWSDAAPFVDPDPWAGYFGASLLPLRLTRDAALVHTTTVVFCALTLAVVLIAGLLFRRPARTLRMRMLTAGLAVLFALLFAAAKVTAGRIPESSAAASIDLHVKDPLVIAADHGMVAVAGKETLAFLDFRDSAHPREAVVALMPLFTPHSVVLHGDTAFVVGERKSLPQDEIQLAIVHLGGSSVELADPIRFGPADSVDYADAPIIEGNSVFIAVVRKRECRIEAYDFSTGSLVSELTVDTFHPDLSGLMKFKDNKASMRMAKLGKYLYVTSPSALTTVEVSVPAAPRLAGRIPYRPPVRLFQGWPRDLVTDGHYLVESEMYPAIAAVYDLSDPAHPLEQRRYPVHFPLKSADGLLFERWREGVLAFRAKDGRFEASQYVTPSGSLFAVSGNFVYAITRDVTPPVVTAHRVR